MNFLFSILLAYFPATLDGQLMTTKQTLTNFFRTFGLNQIRISQVLYLDNGTLRVSIPSVLTRILCTKGMKVKVTRGEKSCQHEKLLFMIIEKSFICLPVYERNKKRDKMSDGLCPFPVVFHNPPLEPLSRPTKISRNHDANINTDLSLISPAGLQKRK